MKFSSLLSSGGRFYYEMVVLPQLHMNGSVNEINFEISNNGHTFPCLLSAATIKDDEGKLRAINVIIFNITHRKQYESVLKALTLAAENQSKRLEVLSNALPNPIWTSNQNGEVEFVNERFFQVFGNRVRSLRFRSFLHLVHSSERRRAFAAWKAALNSKAELDIEVKIKVESRQYEWFLIHAVPFIDKSGTVSNWFGSLTNINEQKEQERKTVGLLNESLEEAGVELDKKSQTLRQIAFDQSHLIRHPLTNILGLTKIIADLPVADDVKELVSMLKTSAEQLDTVITNIVYKTSN
jgi:PAS domain S-box-containing protein